MTRPLPLRREITQDRAKRLRSIQTPAEQLVWSLLRDRRLAGLKFRRQFPIGPYIADFYCHEVKLVVELDGDSHEKTADEDAERTRYLETRGLRILRVQNAEVLSDLESVAFGILKATGIDVQAWLAERERGSRERSAPSPWPSHPKTGARGRRQSRLLTDNEQWTTDHRHASPP
jgi:very-short-patch-repair endonuclease